MDHFPIFLALGGREVVVSGGGPVALAKLRLLLKSTARITVHADAAVPEIAGWARDGRLHLTSAPLTVEAVRGAALLYAANDDASADAAVRAIGRAAGVLTNVVDNLEASDFITPAIVDRDPVTVAIGTEGAAPVLARGIKAMVEAALPAGLGRLARAGQAFRRRAERLPQGRQRRAFWSEFYFGAAGGPDRGAEDLDRTLSDLLERHLAEAPAPGRVDLVGAGPGDPELLTLKARKALDAADVVIHDRLVSPEILDLVRREAVLIEAGKTGFGPSMSQSDIDALMIDHAQRGAHVVRLKAGDPGVFGRLDEETDALTAAGVAWTVVPGITAATAAVAQIGQSFTRRGRNTAFRVITGHDAMGFADHDWRALAHPGEVAAIYMGKRSARFLQGRLLMHGADPSVPVTVVENASRPDSAVIETTLGSLAAAVEGVDGPAVLLYGIAPRSAAAAAAPREVAL